MRWRLVPGNPMAKVLRVTLGFQAIIHALAIAGMIQVDDVGPLLAGLTGGGAAVLALVAAARLEKPGGHALGWLTQLAGVALGFLTGWMFAMGAIFTLVYGITFVLGVKLEERLPGTGGAAGDRPVV